MPGVAVRKRNVCHTEGAPSMAIPVAVSTDVRGKRVLVIDDDHAVRTMLLVILESAEYDVLGVSNDDEALAVAAQWRPDVIVLDILMPTMTGREFLDRRAAMLGLRRVPVIVVTAAAIFDVPTAEQLGVRAVVQKPHDVGVLRALIEDSVLETAGIARADRSPRSEAPGQVLASVATGSLGPVSW